MPGAIVWAVSLIGAGVGGVAGAFVTMYATQIATFAILAGGLAYSGAQKRKAEKMLAAQMDAGKVDRMVNVASPVAPRELVLGRVRKGGTIFWKASTGENYSTFVMCVALAAHEIDAIEKIYLNDVEVTLDGSGYVLTEPYGLARTENATESFSGASITLAHAPVADSVFVTRDGATVAHTLAGSTVTIGDADGGIVQYQWLNLRPKVRITQYLGSPTQTADARLQDLFPHQWTIYHRAQGVAYLIVECLYDDGAFPSGLPNVTALVRGAKIYDPRTATTAWTENPALMCRHVLLHPQFGKRTAITAAEDARITAAANACDVSTVYKLNGVDQTARALYTAAIVLPFGAEAKAALDDLTQAMAGEWCYSAGEVHIIAGAYTASVLTLTDADLAVSQRGQDGAASQSPIGIVTHRSRDQQFNVVTPTIWDASQGYKQTALSPLKGTALIARDGAELVQDVNMPAVGYAPQALHIAGIMLRDARDPLTVSLPFKLTAYPVEVFDTISLTIARYGWSAKTFRVRSRDNGHNGTILLTLKEVSASIYTRDADFIAQGGAANTLLPSPWSILPPAITSVTSGEAESLVQADGTVVPRVRVVWTAIVDDSVTVGGQVELQWAVSEAVPVWTSVVVAGNETQALITGVPDNTVILIRARTRNPAAVSDWGTQQAHRVTGRTTAPPAVTKFSLLEQPGGVRKFFWEYDPVPPSDLAGFEVRYTLGTSALAWASMLPLFSKDAAARSNEIFEPFGDDTYTFSIRAFNNTGLTSTVVDLTEVLDGGQYGTLDLLVLPHQETWPGTRTNCALSGTELLGSVGGAQTWSSWSTSWTALSAWTTGSSDLQYQHTTIDRGTSAARTITAAYVGEGTATIEYCSSADDVTYTAWAAIPGTPVTARYYRLRWSIPASTTPPRLIRAQVAFYI